MSQPIKPNQSSIGVPNSTGPVGEFDVELLLNQGGEILKREMSVLLRESNKGIKLDSAQARDLVNYIKLLADIRESQKDELKNMTNEELEKLAGKGG